MGHAGAIITGATGTYQSKINKLREANVRIAEKPSDIPSILMGVLRR
jgi:succinyl-CoA synthetase alpha subunit